jgi:hypothetical protein
VYAGHAALALLAKAVRPRLPFWLLVPVAFAPDWIQWALEAIGHHNTEYSHSLVAVGAGASVVAIAYWVATREPGDALVLWLLYLSHWAADFITGSKPTWPGGPTVGLGLYGRPAWDFAIEGAVIVGAWLVYRRSLASVLRRHVALVLIPLGLLSFQVAFEAIQAPEIRAALREIP